MEEKWVVTAKRADFAAISARFGIDPVIARIIRNRDVIGDEAVGRYLNGTLADLEDPLLLGPLREAAQLLHEKIAAGKRIRVIGDYDIDGVCATYILLHALRAAGADADFAIPERMRDGYGLNMRLVREAQEEGIDTLLTCDNGIAAYEQIRTAKEAGMTVIITDHHECPYEEGGAGGDSAADGDSEVGGAGWDGDQRGVRRLHLPPADLIIDPRLPDCAYPNKELCGAGVAWKLVSLYEALYLSGDVSEAGESGGGAAENTSSAVHPCTTGRSAAASGNMAAAAQAKGPLAQQLLPFAAFATVGDVMDLTGENRILVREGLQRLAHSDNIGMRALIAACGLTGKPLTAYHIGFVLGPCVNASGRLDTAMRSIRLFSCGDEEEAAILAGELRSLNEERRAMTDDGLRRAMEKIGPSDTAADKVLVVWLADCHESVAGIIAGKLREIYNRPAIVLTDAQESGFIKGSGRSTECYPMFEALSRCSALLEKFGGHPMAAGLTLRRENLEPLRRALNEQCGLTDEDLVRKVRIDAAMPIHYMTETLIEQLSVLEPCGKGNEKPLFAQADLNLLAGRLLGRDRNMMKLTVRDSAGCVMDALWFGDAAELQAYLAGRFGDSEVRRLMMGEENACTLSVTYYPQINEFRGRRSLQIVIRNYR